MYKASLLVSVTILSSLSPSQAALAAGGTAKTAPAAKSAKNTGAKQSAKRQVLGSKAPAPRAFTQGFRDKLFKGKVSESAAAGEKLLIGGKLPQAQDAFRQALNKNSRDTAALTGLGLAQALQFKLDAADDNFAKALKVDPKYALAYVGQGLCRLYRLQSSNMSILQQRPAMLTAAEASCRTALRYDSKSGEAYFVLGLIQKEQGRPAEAKNSMTSAIAIDPHYANAYVQRGLLELAGNDAASAFTDFNEAIALKSDNSTAHYGLGCAYLRQNQLDLAQKELNTAISLNRNSAPSHIAMGDVYRAQDNRVAAINEYQIAINIKAESDQAYLRMSEIREGRGDLELALADIRSGLELSPNSIDLHRRAGDITLKLAKTDDALKEYTTVLQLNQGDAAAVKGMTRALVIKAQKDANGAFFLSNNFDSAKALIGRAIQLNPNDMELRLADAKLRSMMGETIELSTVGTPTNDAERIAYAEACLAQFKYPEAASAMQTVIGNCQSSGQVFAVADMALMIRDLDSAEAAYKRAATFNDADAPSRSKRGLDAVAAARDKAKQSLTMASDLAKGKQYQSAIDNFRTAAYLNPRLPQAHLGLADSLEKLWKDKSPALREAALHYRAYISLEPTMPEKQVEKYTNKANKADEIAAKIEAGKPPSKLSAIFSPFGTFAAKVGSEFKQLVK